MRLKSLLFLSLIWTSSSFTQTPLSGIINQYTSVSSYDSCLSILTIADPTNFAVGDQVLIIQMQGASINEANNASFGAVNDLGSAGLYERALIQDKDGNQLFLENRLLHTYDFTGSVQLVSFPQYDDATIEAELTGQAWDGNTGGVIALEVSGTLTMNAGIRADGLGFRGGQTNVLSSNCQWFLDEDNYFYDLSNWRGAPKGEGVATIIPGKEAGRGPQANGGGGGNDHNTGGGGGGNVSAGGIGGEQTPSSTFQCQGEFPGEGGRALAISSERVFLGGGGGAGHVDNTGAGSNGGHGGGIVILIANSLNGMDQTISANGEDAPFAPGDGAGGGGGAGSIVLDVVNVFSLYYAECRGGAGGDTQNFADRCFGPGGGGAGGHLLLNTVFFPIANLDGGTPGENTTSSSACNSLSNGATSGQNGVQTLFSSFPEGTIPVDKISLLAQPNSEILACEDETLNLSVSATGMNLQFQWQVDTGNGFMDIVDGGIYGGSQTNNLQINPIEVGLEGYQYQCLIFNDCFNEQTTPSSLSVVSAPIVDFLAEVGSGTTVQFENLSQFGDSYVWDFGDGTGNQSTLSNPNYTFPADGTYLVTLQAENGCGINAIAIEITISSIPTANFITDIQQGCAPLTVQYTSLASDNADSLSWIFPGGSPMQASGQNVTVTYSEPGTYEAALIAINSAGADTLTLSEWVQVQGPPQADFSAIIDQLTIVFQNNTLDGSSYFWDFGDQMTSIAEAPTHNYLVNGVYEVTLIATNDCGQDTSIQTITTGIVPEANFVSESTGGCAPLTVNYVDLSQGLISSRMWTFPGGNPSTSSDSAVTVVYENPGVFDVELIVTNATAADTVFQPEYIEVLEQPIAGFSFVQNGGTVQFTNESVGTNLNYNWDFGDNSSGSNEANPSHTYTIDGTYEIILTVSNPYCGGIASNFIEIKLTGIQDRPLDAMIELAPNPVSEILWVKAPIAKRQTLHFQLVNLAGQSLERWESSGWSTPLDLSGLPAGLYYLEVQTATGNAHFPIIKQ